MLLVDITIVQVALPQIQRELHASLTQLQWVIDAYALALASLILISGSLSDRLGRQRVFLFGVAIFTLASVLCGLASTIEVLISARVLQGVGGAAMFATSLALIGQEFSGRERGTAIAYWSSTVGGAVAVGPLLGGALTDGLGWQWIFYVNVPVGLAAIAVGLTRTTNIADPNPGRLDVGGLVTLASGLFLLIYGVLRGRAEGWGSGLIVSGFIGGAVLMLLFVLIELRVAKPMFDLSLFRLPSFVGVSVATFAIGAGMFSMFLFITLYLQNILGYSAFDGGLRLLPTTVFVFVVPLLTRRFVPSVSPRLMLSGGLVAIAVGLLWMHQIDASSSWTALLGGSILAGTGIGLANPAIAAVALGVVVPQRSGMASGISNTFRISGVAVGIAVNGAVFASALASRLADLLPGRGPGFADAVSAAGVHAAKVGDSASILAIKTAFTGAFGDLTILGAAMTLVGAAAAFVLIRPMPGPASAAPAPAEAPAQA